MIHHKLNVWRLCAAQVSKIDPGMPQEDAKAHLADKISGFIQVGSLYRLWSTTQPRNCIFKWRVLHVDVVQKYCQPQPCAALSTLGNMLPAAGAPMRVRARQEKIIL